jgi:hypothetical protein
MLSNTGNTGNDSSNICLASELSDFKYFGDPKRGGKRSLSWKKKKENTGSYTKLSRCLLAAYAATKFNRKLDAQRKLGVNKDIYKAHLQGKKNVRANLLWKSSKQTVREIIKQQKWLINPFGVFFVLWNSLQAILILYAITFMPFGLIFMADNDTRENIESIMNYFFIVDIVINFFTAIAREDESVVTSHKEIAIQYLRGFFVVDVVSSIPFNLFQANPSGANTILRVLKFPRLLRLFKLGKMLKLKDLYRGTAFSYFLKLNGGLLKVLSLTASTILLLHFAACIFSATAYFDADNYRTTWIRR